MASIKKTAIRSGLEALYFSGLHHAMRPLVGGVGVILTLHHVRPRRRGQFQPNRLLEITPRYLDAVLTQLRRWKFDIISLDEMYARLATKTFDRRFVCFTLDDAYADNLEFAYPIFKKHDAPFALFVPTSFPDRRGELWWVAIESVIAKNDSIGLLMHGREQRLECRSVSEKRELYEALYSWLRDRDSDDEIRQIVRDLAARYHVDIAQICQQQCLTWDQIGELAKDPLVTIGAHTVNHPILTKIPTAKVTAELKMSRAVIEGAIGTAPAHFAYPFGQRYSAGVREFRIARDLGFKTALTTRPGVIFPEHINQLWSLPRISLNGDYQQLRYLRVLVSGAATALWNGFRRVDAA
jgi:peptidoglycan/xylan/chitin deacetylase (PgdA/CDA1 family)